METKENFARKKPVRFLDQKDFARLAEQEKLEVVLQYACLAPSSHNTQPWLFKASAESIDILPNFNRRLPGSDPQDRELHLSLGAAAANIAAILDGYGIAYGMRFLPAPDTAVAFRFDNLAPSGFNRELAQALIGRHNNRSVFDNQPLKESFVLAARNIAEKSGLGLAIVTDKETKDKVALLVGEAIEQAFLDKKFTSELSHWVKPNLKKYRDGMPGYNMGVPWLISFLMPLAIGKINMSKTQRKMNEPALNSAAGFFVFHSPEDKPDTWLKTGFAFEQLAIEAQLQDVKIGVLAAPIEITDYPKRLKKLLNLAGTPQMFFRAGSSQEIPAASPRLAVESVIIS